ncbi:MAG: hypothetical protein IT229_09055 [Flavobacteriales bacterium]|nr:hypothetical protein [Flavobacteriales bacterium]
MHKCHLLAPLLYLFSLALQAQAPFAVLSGGPYAEDGVGVIRTGSSFQVATRTFDPAFGHRAEIRTVSNSGALLSVTPLSLPGQVFIQAMEPTLSGGAFIVGALIPADSVEQDALILKVDGNNALLWSLAPNLPAGQVLMDATVLADGSVVATGTTTGPDKHDALVMRVSSNGQLMWTTALPGALDEEGHGIASDATGVMITGRQMNFGGTSDCLFARFDLNGSLQWASSWGGSRDDVGRAIARTASGDFVMAGRSNSFGPYDHTSGTYYDQRYLIALTANGDTLWTRSVGDTIRDQGFNTIAIASNGELYLAGEHPTDGNVDALVTKTTSNGTPIWEHVYDLDDWDEPLDIRTLTDGAVVCGWSFSPLSRQVMVLRTDTQGN